MTGGTPTLGRILVVHSRYLSGHASGENRVVEDEIGLLREAGYHVEALVRQVEPGRSKLNLAAEVVWGREAIRELNALIRSHRPDVVHFHNLFPAVSPAPLRAARRAGLPTVVTLHNFRFMCLAGTFLRDSKICEDCLGRPPWKGVLHGCYRGSRAESAALASSLSAPPPTGHAGRRDAVPRRLPVRAREAHRGRLPPGGRPGSTKLRDRRARTHHCGRVLPLPRDGSHRRRGFASCSQAGPATPAWWWSATAPSGTNCRASRPRAWSSVEPSTRRTHSLSSAARARSSFRR